MNRGKLFPRWQRQYRRLLQRQELLFHLAHKKGQPEHIHDLRVTLRRLRVMLRVCAPLLETTAVAQYLRWSKKITLATSHLRDFDVTLEWLASQPNAHHLANSLSLRRQRLWKMSRARCVPLPRDTRIKLRRLSSKKPAREHLYQRYLAECGQLEHRVYSRISQFFELDEAERHGFRRTVRMLRYLREFVIPASRHKTDPWLHSLIRPQAAMGEYQNRVLANQILSSNQLVSDHADLHRVLVREQAHWQREIKNSLRALTQYFNSR